MNLKFLYILFSIIIAFFVFPNFFEYTVSPIISSKDNIWQSLDPSWALALNYIKNHDYVWGTDFVFTYGPLSFFSTRIGWGCNKYLFLIYDIFYFLNIFLISYFTISEYKNKVLTFLSLLFLAFLIPSYLGGANALVFFLFLIFWLVRSIENKGLINYFFQIILIVLLFFIKFNTAILSLFLFTIVLVYLFISKKEKLFKLLLLYFVPVLLIFFLSIILNLDIVNYINSGFEIVSGYNDIMYLNDASFKLKFISFLIIIIFLLFFSVQLLKSRQNNSLLKDILLFFIFSVAIFILHKQAFIRADTGHIMEFYKYLILLVISFKFFYSHKFLNIKSLLSLIVIVLPFYVCFKNYGWEIFNYKEKLDKTVYFEQFKSFNETSGLKLFPNNNALPDNVLNIISNETVDIFPWNIHLLLENKLNYHPRPVIQSYTAYTKYLEELNFEFYNGKNAPKYVIYDYASIDYRYPLFDESKVNIALLKNYVFKDLFVLNERKMILLERKDDFKPIKMKFLKQYAIYSNSLLIPKEGIFYEIEFYATLKGKLYSVLQHAPEIKFSIKNSNNLIKDYKSSILLLKSGIFSQYHVESTEDFYKLLINKQEEVSKIKEYVFYPIDNQHFNDKIKITEYKIIQ